ncbi:MAG: hypothetical protein H7067_11530, partial [Burkholderiales bacterium]|nr:hypothetical protein [Opitutaceae bacterium]
MRRPIVPRVLLLGALASVLWFGQALPSRHERPGSPSLANAAPRVADQAKPSRAARATAASAAPVDTLVNLSTGTRSQPLSIALDELYFPDRTASARLTAIPSQADLGALLAYVATLPFPAPRLVLYPVGGPRNASTRRIVTPGVEIALHSADAPTPGLLPDLGVISWERPAYAPGHAIARISGDPAQPLRAAAALARLPGIASARPLLARLWSRKIVPSDPLFKDQW